MNRTPHSTPNRDPRPPANETPPSRIAVSTRNSMLLPIDWDDASSLASSISPPRAAQVAEAMKSPSTMRLTGMPSE